jgi:hypothetical protein
VCTKRAVVLAVIAWLAVASPAQAENPYSAQITVHADGAPDCPDSAALSASVRELAGASVVQDDEALADISFVVEISSSRDGYRAIVRASGKKNGTRELTDSASTCAGLANGLAITVATLLDRSDPADEPPPPPPPPPPAPERRVTPAAPPPEATPPASTVALSTEGAVEASSLAAIGFLGPLDLGASVAQRVALSSRFSLAGGAAAFVPSRADLGAGHVNLGLWHGFLRACYRVLGAQGVRLALCGEPNVGVLSVEGVGFPINRTTNRPFLAAVLDAEARGPIGSRFEWIARAGISAPLQRQTVVVDDVGTVWQSSLLSGRIGLGLGLKVW